MEKCESLFEIWMVVDSVFQCVNRSIFIWSAQDHEPTDVQDFGEYALFSQATSACQMAEWGMYGFQALFPCSKGKMKFEEPGEQVL